METECVSETSEVFKQLARLSAREGFIQFCRRESLRTYSRETVSVSRRTLLHGIKTHTLNFYGACSMVQEGRSSDGCVLRGPKKKQENLQRSNLSWLQNSRRSSRETVIAKPRYTEKKAAQSSDCLREISKHSFPFNIFVLNIPTFLLCGKEHKISTGLRKFGVQCKSTFWVP
jgi:hypothetical protein